MKARLLLSFLSLFLFIQLIRAQPKQPDPALWQRMQQYAIANHLYPGGTYIYFDTVSKKPYRFSPKDFMVEDLSNPPVWNNVFQASDPTAKVLGGVNNFHLIKDVNNLTDANPFG